MMTDDQKVSIREQLDVAEKLLIAGASWADRLMALPAEVQEAARLLKNLEDRLPVLQTMDPAFHTEVFLRIETMWAQYLKVSNMSGLSVLAEIALACR